MYYFLLALCQWKNNLFIVNIHELHVNEHASMRALDNLFGT